MRKSKSGWTKITQDEVNNIKLMQKRGLSQKEVAKITGRSKGSVSYIFRSNGTLDDYRRVSSPKVDEQTSLESEWGGFLDGIETVGSDPILDLDNEGNQQDRIGKILDIVEANNMLIHRLIKQVSGDEQRNWRIWR